MIESMIELTKEQKKIARSLIDLGLERECEGIITDEEIAELGEEAAGMIHSIKSLS